MEALLFIITNPSRIWRAIKLKDEVCCLKRTVEILKDTGEHFCEVSCLFTFSISQLFICNVQAYWSS